MKNIVLIGFMGSGKTTVGKELTAYGYRFLDTDETIERQEGRSISDIFATDGEAAFRDMETELLRRLEQQEGLVISCGGGMPVREENRALLKSAGEVFWLWADAEDILKRLAKDTSRPLLQGEDREQKVRRMMEQRHDAYTESSQHVVKTGKKWPRDIAREIVEVMKRGSV